MLTLLELLPRLSKPGNREAVRWNNGLRTRVTSYADLHSLVRSIAGFLDEKGIQKGDRLLIWSENRPEWVAVFWACMARGIQIVPVDFRFSADLVRRIETEARPKLMVFGNAVDAREFQLPRVSCDEISRLPKVSRFTPIEVSPDDVVEIVYTSGTTGEPKGVVHRHRNICANLTPFAAEIDKYRHWARPFQPIRILDLLPLSHMFGQLLGIFIPALFEGSATFTSEIHPGKIIRVVRDHRVSVIVSVPRILENLRNEVTRQFNVRLQPGEKIGIARRWWRYRKVHRRFGLKFWAFVVGGARVDPDLEEYWRRLGFLVVQGYGLTEASPVVAVNHPFHTRPGSLGKVVAGQDVMIAPDGEILVRGPSVITAEGEWLHTGDLGEIDADGRFYYRGRKKDLIVTAEGLNVSPDDVENVLHQIPEIRDSAVVGVTRNGHDVVHAVLILKEPLADPEMLIRHANDRLEAHQRIKEWSIWPETDFPRTPSTLKVRRNEVARLLGKTVGSGLQPRARLDLSAMSSLERVELLSDLEDRLHASLDEDKFSKLKTTEELNRWLELPAQERQSSPEKAFPVAEWARSRPIRWLGAACQRALILPLFRHYLPLTVAGLENLETLEGPVIFAANHTSHLDTVSVFAALPGAWRKRIAPAMLKEHFKPHFEPDQFSWVEVWKSRLSYIAACIVFNAYPLPQMMAGSRRALRYTGELVSRGYCPLVFPEGRRTPDGRLLPFRPGIGMMAAQLGVPVVPIHIEGLFKVYSVHDSWPRRGPVRITIGHAMEFPAGASYEQIAAALQEAVAGLRNKRGV